MLMVAIKVVVTAALVLALSWVSDRAGPKTAGVLAGFPLGVAVSLFFIGVEQGPDFAAAASISTIGGLGAAMVFCFAYWQISWFLGFSLVHWFSYWKVRGSPVLWAAFLTSLVSIVVFLIVAGMLAVAPQQRLTLAIITLVLAGLAWLFFRRIDDVAAEAVQPMVVTPLMLVARAAFAAVIVLIVTSLAGAIGETWAGLLAGFPVTLFPLFVIVHVTHGEQHVHAIIKSLPYGIAGLVIFALAGSYVFEPMGIYLGTVLALVLSLAYLAVVAAIVLRTRRPGGAD